MSTFATRFRAKDSPLVGWHLHQNIKRRFPEGAPTRKARVLRLVCVGFHVWRQLGTIDLRLGHINSEKIKTLGIVSNMGQ